MDVIFPQRDFHIVFFLNLSFLLNNSNLWIVSSVLNFLFMPHSHQILFYLSYFSFTIFHVKLTNMRKDQALTSLLCSFEIFSVIKK